ncbi:hypothetical protein B0H14DRAFT_2654791 [Mycena olivaceomarginata]|nr:hypothetical protein B0H14DRAFT_2654791 [Mycena olivaceomarginata]
MQTLTPLIIATGLALSVCAFDGNRSDNIAIYWGQNSYGSRGNDTKWQQKDLGAYCEDTSVNVIPIAFLDAFFGPGGVPIINLANMKTHKSRKSDCVIQKGSEKVVEKDQRVVLTNEDEHRSHSVNPSRLQPIPISTTRVEGRVERDDVGDGCRENWISIKPTRVEDDKKKSMVATGLHFNALEIHSIETILRNARLAVSKIIPQSPNAREQQKVPQILPQSPNNRIRCNARLHGIHNYPQSPNEKGFGATKVALNP